MSVSYPVVGGGGPTIGAPGAASDGNGLLLAAGVLSGEYADATHPGLVSTGAQAFAGVKTLSSLQLGDGILNTSAAGGFKLTSTAPSGDCFEVYLGVARCFWVDGSGNIASLGSFTCGSGISATGYIQSAAGFASSGTTAVYGQANDGSGAQTEVVVGSLFTTLTNPASKLLSCRNNGTETAFVCMDGTFESLPVGAGFVLKSPDGTRWRIKVANTTGALSAVAA